MTRAEREARLWNAAFDAAKESGAHPVAAIRAADAALTRERSRLIREAEARRALARQREAEAAAHFAFIRDIHRPPA